MPDLLRGEPQALAHAHEGLLADGLALPEQALEQAPARLGGSALQTLAQVRGQALTQLAAVLAEALAQVRDPELARVRGVEAVQLGAQLARERGACSVPGVRPESRSPLARPFGSGRFSGISNSGSDLKHHYAAFSNVSASLLSMPS